MDQGSRFGIGMAGDFEHQRQRPGLRLADILEAGVERRLAGRTGGVARWQY
jgi:hypothetical protein